MRLLTPTWTTRGLASDLFDEMDRFFVDWSTSSTDGKINNERGFAPACEISENEQHFLMSFDLPGMKKENIKIDLSGNALTITGERKREETDKNRKVQHYEKSYGFFKRSFTLPETVDANKVEARYEDGVLELYLPKIEAAKPRNIEIQTGKESFFEKLLSGNNNKKSTQDAKDVNSTIAS